MRHFRSMPVNPTVIDVYAIDPEMYRHWMEMGARLLEGESAFSIGQRELMSAYVSSLNACAFCVNMHRTIAKAWGIADGLLERLVEDLDEAPLDPKAHLSAAPDTHAGTCEA